jgi:8-oxo-dGTP pyrophosphatase MutT (NUDIX family)
MQSGIAVGAVAIILQNDQVLLTLREDYEVWCLPGGHSDPGEGFAATAIREAKEETGLDIELIHFVGAYTRIGGDMTIHLAAFLAKPAGGSPAPQVEEVLDLRYFDPADLPRDMFWWHRQPIRDALNGARGVAYTATVETPETVRSRQELYALRDRSGMSRPAFYHYFFESGNNRLVRDV